jgi:DNA-binding CsgD family transcriptional regulator
MDKLTSRQQQVARLVSEGNLNREIAERLGISLHSAKQYIHQVVEKLGLEGQNHTRLLISNAYQQHALTHEPVEICNREEHNLRETLRRRAAYPVKSKNPPCNPLSDAAAA